MSFLPSLNFLRKMQCPVDQAVPDCALIIDRRHPAALNMSHKASALVITNCQSVIIKYDGCCIVCFFRP